MDTKQLLHKKYNKNLSLRWVLSQNLGMTISFLYLLFYVYVSPRELKEILPMSVLSSVLLLTVSDISKILMIFLSANVSNKYIFVYTHFFRFKACQLNMRKIH